MHTLSFRHYNCLHSKIVHTNLHKVNTNRVNRPHDRYGNSYYTQITTLVRKTKYYWLNQLNYWSVKRKDIGRIGGAVVLPTLMLHLDNCNEVLMDSRNSIITPETLASKESETINLEVVKKHLKSVVLSKIVL